MRILLLLPLLAACTVPAPVIGLGAADVASVAVFGRGIGDIGVSAISGRDCSIVRLDKGQTYCAPLDPGPACPVFCTRSLGSVDCWRNPERFSVPPRRLADTPPPTLAQERYRAAPWPKTLTAN
jgi:hypothetical protein